MHHRHHLKSPLNYRGNEEYLCKRIYFASPIAEQFTGIQHVMLSQLILSTEEIQDEFIDKFGTRPNSEFTQEFMEKFIALGKYKEESSSSTAFVSTRRTRDLNHITCFKCHKKGHYVNECRSKSGIRNC
ncbi:hypothetical protein CAAN1_19S00100 [[Candida] anglica]|uniref:CCHC-type domain-containing protein n=1 Tax=[Candida] anglica TaxID=148631 RepID=A0ABP0E5D1_9ASCO